MTLDRAPPNVQVVIGVYSFRTVVLFDVSRPLSPKVLQLSLANQTHVATNRYLIPSHQLDIVCPPGLSSQTHRLRTRFQLIGFMVVTRTGDKS